MRAAVTMSVDIAALFSECRIASDRQMVRPPKAVRSPYVRKGVVTHSAIVAHALHVASRRGLDAISFGSIADQLMMCKSGVFNHFGSRDKLLIDVLSLYQTMFKAEVLLPSLKRPQGLPRLVSMYALWMERFIAEEDSNCLFISGAITSRAHDGPVRDKLLEMVNAWKGELHRCVVQAIHAGHLCEDTDPWQIVYEMYGLALRLHHGVSLFETAGGIERAMRGFERLILAHALQSP